MAERSRWGRIAKLRIASTCPRVARTAPVATSQTLLSALVVARHLLGRSIATAQSGPRWVRPSTDRAHALEIADVADGSRSRQRGMPSPVV
jgi:hypothetical protein